MDDGKKEGRKQRERTIGERVNSPPQGEGNKKGKLSEGRKQGKNQRTRLGIAVAARGEIWGPRLHNLQRYPRVEKSIRRGGHKDVQ